VPGTFLKPEPEIEMYENSSKKQGARLFLERAEDESQEAVKIGTGPLTLALINIQSCYHSFLFEFYFVSALYF
jgi:hypothetical protein